MNSEDRAPFDSIVIEHNYAIMHVAMIALAYRLALEINTGLTFGRSSLAIARENGYTRARRKAQGLRDMVGLIQAHDPSWTPRSSIERALAKD